MVNKKGRFMLKRALMMIAIMAFATSLWADDQTVSFSDAYVRANIPGQKMAAGFITIHNHSAKPIILQTIQTDAAKSVQLHAQSIVAGQMKMRKLENLDIPANGKVDFKASGYHLMLIGLKAPLQENATIKLELCFDTVCSTIKVPVRSIFNENTSKTTH